MTKVYEFWLYKNLHKGPYEERGSGRIIETTWDQLEPPHTSLEEAKAAAGTDVKWLKPVSRARPNWLPSDAEWLPEFDHYSTDGEWYILQYNVEAE